MVWLPAGSEHDDDDDELADWRVPCGVFSSVSLSPLTPSSAFDQLQVQPRNLTGFLYCTDLPPASEPPSGRVHPVNTPFGCKHLVLISENAADWLDIVVLFCFFSGSRLFFFLIWAVRCEEQEGRRIPTSNQKFISVDCLWTSGDCLLYN